MLLAIALIGLLPVGAFAVFVIVELWKTQQAQLHQSLSRTASALAAVVEENVAGSVHRLELLADEPSLKSGTLPQFDERARAYIAGRWDWEAVAMMRLPDYQQVINTRRPYGAELPLAGERSHLEHAVRTRSPVVSDLFVGVVARRPIVNIVVPVIRDGEVRYVLALTVDNAALSDLLRRHLREERGIAGIVDSQGLILARTRDPAAFLGKTLVPPLAAAVRETPEGRGRFPVADAPPTFSAWVPVAGTPWTLVIGTPAAPVEAALWRSLALMGGLLGVMLVASGALAWSVSRYVVRGIDGAARGAEAMAAGRPVHGERSMIREIDALDGALARSSQRLVAAQGEAAALAGVVTALSGTLDLARMLQTIADAARVVTASDMARIALPAGDGSEMRYRYLTGTRAGGYYEVRILPGRGFVGRVMQTRRPFRTHDAPNDPAVEPVHRALIEAEGTRTALVVPIIESDVLQGIVYVGRRTPTPYTDADEAACVRLAGQAALALRNARLYAQEQTAREQAEAANRAKDEFLAMLGHELRNPLGAISMAAHVLKSAALSADATAARDIIARQTAHLGRILDDLLDVGRVVSGKISLKKKRVNLDPLVREAVATLQAGGHAAKHRISLRTQPAWVDADPARIVQIVANLVGNAVKFSAEGSELVVAVRTEEAHAVIEVIDPGIGIPPEMLERVFDLFVQAHADSARQRGGLGIGLTLVRRLAELHGGTVHAHSEGAGHGARFTVRLPLAARAALESDAPRPALSAKRALKILLVEDNHDARQTLARVLELAGHSVRAVASAKEALAFDVLEADVALLDIGLPGMDGYALAAELRRRHGPGLPMIALTGYGQGDDRARAVAAGFDAHFTKPVDPELLVSRLTSITEGASR